MSSSPDSPSPLLSCSRNRSGDVGGWTMRNMRPEDLPEIMLIELASYPHPWRESLFLSCLDGDDYRCHVLEEHGRIIAYLLLSVAVGECHVLNVCCDPSVRRRGVARYILNQGFTAAATEGAEMVFLEVRVSNVNAIGLYEAMGFIQVGRRKNYYPAAQGREDALLYRLDLVGTGRVSG